MRASAGARRSGFTLLEVLVAAALLALLYVTLAGVALQGLRAEGEAERRLRASLLADRTLAALEAQAAAGTAPEIGLREDDDGEFLVAVDVTAFDLPLPPAEPGARGRAAPRQSLLRPIRGGPSPVRQVEVRVSWIEGASERTVTRATHIFDFAAAEPLLEQIAPAEAEEEPPS